MHHITWRVGGFVVLLFIALNGLAGSIRLSLAEARAASPAALAALEDSLEQVYVEVNPSVVNIRVLQEQEVSLPAFPEIPGLPFAPSDPSGSRKLLRQGSGSGFVWDTQGHIVINNHVIADADRISVTFHDGITVNTAGR